MASTSNLLVGISGWHQEGRGFRLEALSADLGGQVAAVVGGWGWCPAEEYPFPVAGADRLGLQLQEEFNIRWNRGHRSQGKGVESTS